MLVARAETEIEKVARDARLPVRELRPAIRKVRRSYDAGGREVIERTGIPEDEWKEFDSRVRRELRRRGRASGAGQPTALRLVAGQTTSHPFGARPCPRGSARRGSSPDRSGRE